MRRRVRVTGDVQGVAFRAHTRREAEARGVSGWVRNREDGSVEAVFEGTAHAVTTLVAICRTGPPDARVRTLDCVAEAPEGLRGFRVAP